MKRSSVVVLLVILSFITHSQNNLKIAVKSEETREPLIGASVVFPLLNKGASTDSLGIASFHDLPDGTFGIEISFIGYALSKQKITLPFTKSSLEVVLEESSDEDNPQIVISTTRTDRSVRNTPTRVEVIAGGEIAENVSMRPGEIKMLLNETTGLITQPTSAISNTANLRIQELDGRYTQILRDGFPLYSGLSEGLSLVQIAPLDLRQVEIIKGSASTLYGGGAIAGLINLVSKTPTDKREISFIANGTSAGGLDLSGFYSQRYGKIGATFFGSRNSGMAYDPSGKNFTAIPKFSRYTVTPRLFFYGKNTTANLGVSFIKEDRLGGNIEYVKHKTPGYFERNISKRFTTQFDLMQKLSGHSSLHFKNSFNHYNRSITIPSYKFEGLQQSSFSELSWNGGPSQSQWVGGINLYTDNFKERVTGSYPSRSYQNITFGTFVQNTLSLSQVINMESGLRIDYTNPYRSVILPRLSFLFHFSDAFTSRIGGGLGYKLPAIFTEESEERQFQDILPLNRQQVNNERSTGGNIDFMYKINIDELRLTVNPLFFYTRINHPLVLMPVANNYQEFINANGYTDSKGLDLSFRATLDAIKFFTGYSYTIVQNHFNGLTKEYPLTPKHKLHFDLVYEKEGNLRIAFESYYTSTQQLTDGSLGKSYWLLGALIEKSWKHISLFINGEDLNDVRQTKWGSIFTGTIDRPLFKDIYTPLEGRTINGGIKIKLAHQ
ncbi:MAG: TonB-dependent receptor [Bacteroidota bacterium]|nr:TonB-dependent receptor [Bacteroidota bacterium]